MDDGAFDDEDYNQDPIDEVDIVNIVGLMTMDEDSCFDNVDVPKGSSTPMDQALARLHEITAKITQSVLGVQTSNCAIMQHHFFKELHQTFTTFVGPSERIHAPMNGISLGG